MNTWLTNYTAIVQAVDNYNTEHTAHLFESLTIMSTISISSGSISGEKSLAAKVKLDNTRKMQITALISNAAFLKSA
jgi:methylglyoxal synthase